MSLTGACQNPPAGCCTASSVNRQQRLSFCFVVNACGFEDIHSTPSHRAEEWFEHAVVTMKVSDFSVFLTALDKLLGFVTHETARIIFPDNAWVTIIHLLRQAGGQGQCGCLVLHPAVPSDWAGRTGLSQVRHIVGGAHSPWMPAFVLLPLSSGPRVQLFKVSTFFGSSVFPFFFKLIWYV